ncbi:hypothetical protein [Egbenema bharatensis]|uniref:hypothetical protein n=1 Tax=Egbenema bharatensis TaxID=3463334 RepID=UPI003A88CAE1
MNAICFRSTETSFSPPALFLPTDFPSLSPLPTLLTPHSSLLTPHSSLPTPLTPHSCSPIPTTTPGDQTIDRFLQTFRP